MACGRYLLEQFVDLTRGTDAERQRQPTGRRRRRRPARVHARDGFLRVERQRVSAWQLYGDVRHVRVGHGQPEQPVEVD